MPDNGTNGNGTNGAGSETSGSVDTGLLYDIGKFFSNAFGAKPLLYGLKPEEAKRLTTHGFVFETLAKRGAFSGVPSDPKAPPLDFKLPFNILITNGNQKIVCDQPQAGDWYYARYGYRWSRLEPGLESFFTINNGPPVSAKEFHFDPIDLWPVWRGSLTEKGGTRMTREEFKAGGLQTLTVEDFQDRIAKNWRHRDNPGSIVFHPGNLSDFGQGEDGLPPELPSTNIGQPPTPTKAAATGAMATAGIIGLAGVALLFMEKKS